METVVEVVVDVVETVDEPHFTPLWEHLESPTGGQFEGQLSPDSRQEPQLAYLMLVVVEVETVEVDVDVTVDVVVLVMVDVEVDVVVEVEVEVVVMVGGGEIDTHSYPNSLEEQPS